MDGGVPRAHVVGRDVAIRRERHDVEPEPRLAPGIERQTRDQALPVQAPAPVVPHVAAERQLRMLVSQLDAVVVRRHVDRRVLLALARLRFLDVGEIGANHPRQLALDAVPRVVGDVERDGEAGHADAERQADVERSFRDAVLVRSLHVGRARRATAARLGQLRMNVVQRQRFRIDRGRLAQPGRVAVDLEAQRAEEARLAEVIARQPRGGPALAAAVGDEE